MQADLYGLAKSIAPQKPFGFHILQTVTFSPFYRAEEDYAKRRTTVNFLKIATYNNAGGPRMATYVNDLGHTIFRDAAPKDFLELYYKIMGIPRRPPSISWRPPACRQTTSHRRPSGRSLRSEAT